MKKRNKEPEKEPNHERWLVSYADFITLLFAVFVTLYAMGQVDSKKAQEVIKSLEKAFGISTFVSPGARVIPSGNVQVLPLLGPDENSINNGFMKVRDKMEDLLKIKEQLEQKLDVVDGENPVQLDINPRGLIIILQDDNFFAAGQAKLRPEVYPFLDYVAKTLASYKNSLSIEGFTDDTAIHSQQFASNWELSSSRALSVLHYLCDRHNIDSNRLSATGYGANFPVGDNSTVEGRKRNRRVEIAILAKPGESGPL